MLRDYLRLSGLCVLLLTLNAQAQVETEGEAPDKPIVPAEIADAAGVKPASKPSPNRARQISMLKQFEAEITRALEMDEDQATEVSEIFQEFIEDLSAEADDRREDRRENAELIRELVDEMRDAQKDRDMERVREIREEIAELRSEHGSADESFDPDELFEILREVMSEDQIETFDPLADRFKKSLEGPKKEENPSFASTKSRQCHQPSEDQLATIRRIFVDFAKENRGEKGVSEDADAELYNSILDELDEDQAREFTQKVEEFERMQSRGAKGAREDRKRPAVDRARGEVADEPADDQAEESGDQPVEGRDEPVGEDIDYGDE
ncbi:MAG: hypothetical protein R3E58_16020 [Phycisphaerae bacterium]